MAGDEIAIPILLGFGLDEFSMSASTVLSARSQIAKLSMTHVIAVAEKVLQMDTSFDVKRFIEELKR